MTSYRKAVAMERGDYCACGQPEDDHDATRCDAGTHRLMESDGPDVYRCRECGRFHEAPPAAFGSRPTPGALL